MGRQRARRPGVEKSPCVFRRPVKNDFDVGIAGTPGIFQYVCRGIMIALFQFVSQPVQSLSQRTAPALVPSGVAGIAPAIAAPTFNSMCTAPGGVLNNLDFPLGRKFLLEFSVVSEAGQLI